VTLGRETSRFGEDDYPALQLNAPTANRNRTGSVRPIWEYVWRSGLEPRAADPPWLQISLTMVGAPG